MSSSTERPALGSTRADLDGALSALAQDWDGLRFACIEPAGLEPEQPGPDQPGHEQAGEDTTFLLLHGLGGCLEFWSRTAFVLGERYRTVALDIPGFGHSRAPRAGLSLDAMATDIAEFVKQQDIQHCVLVSHSIGSAVAARLAAQLPDRIELVVFTSGALVRASLLTQNPLRALIAPALGVAVAAQFISGAVRSPRWLRRLLLGSPLTRQVLLWPFVAHPRRLAPFPLAGILANSGSRAVLGILLHARSLDYLGALRAVPQRVCLIWGRRDRLISPRDIGEMRELVQVVAEHPINDCGHWPMVEAPEDFEQQLLTWGDDERERRRGGT